MTKSLVLRFARDDDKKAFVLVRATAKGSNQLDLKLVGTEGELQYATTLKQSQAASLRVKNCPVSESEWTKILQGVFAPEPLPDIQVAATVKSEKSMFLTVRKETQGITQRLGVITLDYDENEVIELFDWCGSIAEAAAASRQAKADSEIVLREKDAAIAKLRSQLEELIQAKGEDEAALLCKFRDLLNEKKVKIREQQRVLASSSVNVSQARPSQSQASISQVVSSLSVKPTRQATKSRASKRKAPASKRDEEESEDENLHAMKVDSVKQEAGETDLGNTTEDTASIVDEDESGDNDDVAHRVGHSGSAEQEKSSSEESPAKTTEEPPARRELPFNNKKPAKKAQAGSETESDDEL